MLNRDGSNADDLRQAMAASRESFRDSLRRRGSQGGNTIHNRVPIGTVPPEVWNRLGTKILPKLRSAQELSIGVNFSVTVQAGLAEDLISDLQQILDDLGLADRVRVE